MMFNKLKATTLAAVIAAATLLGSGQAWAIDLSFADSAGTQESPIPGCDSVQGLPGGVWYVEETRYTGGDQVSFNVRAGTGQSGGPGGAVVIINAPDDVIFWGGSAFGEELFPGFVYGAISQYCTNLTQLSTEFVAPYISGPTGYAEAAFVGTVFTALDSNDGQIYRYTVGFEGVTNTVGVFRREAIDPPDTTAPSVTLSGAPATLTSTDPFTVTATFDEDVTGFDDLANDVTITNGTVTAITGSAQVYTLTIQPTGAGDVTIFVPAGYDARPVAQDAAGNHNTASNTLVIGNRIVEITQEQIAGFMLGRANNLVSNQPGLTRFLMGEGCGAFSANATEGAGSINGCVARGNVWADIVSSWSGEGSYTLGTVGAHGFMNPNRAIAKSW